jgi:hypothetical protein
MFEVGDRIEIVGPPMFDAWIGRTGTVIDIDSVYGPYILPDINRPDGYGRSPFYWDGLDGFDSTELRKIND